MSLEDSLLADGRTPVAGEDDVDVVIPVHNGAAFIIGSITSVFAQTHRPRRLIVVDDGSTDETAAVVGSLAARYPEIILHQLGRNCGLPAARNAGIRFCRSPFVAFLDADDVWTPDKLKLQIEVFRRASGQVGFVHSAYFPLDEAGGRLDGVKSHTPRLKGEILRPLLVDGYAVAGSASSVLVRREVLERTGGFDEKLAYAEDLDLWLRLAAVSHVDFTPEAVVGIRIHSDSMQRRREPGRELRFFMQRLAIFGRWDEYLGDDRGLISRLRNDSYDYLLSEGRSLSRVEEFYTTLKASDQPLPRRLFASRFDLWSGLVARVSIRLLNKAGRGLRRLAGSIVRKANPRRTNAGA